MKKSVRQLFATAGVGVLALMAPLSAFAVGLQSDFEYYVDDSLTSETDAASGALGIFLIAIWCFVIVLSLVTTVIWILAIIDIIKRDNWKSDNDKIIWLLLVIFVNIVSLYYYFFYRKKLDREAAFTKTVKTEVKTETPEAKV